MVVFEQDCYKFQGVHVERGEIELDWELSGGKCSLEKTAQAKHHTSRFCRIWLSLGDINEMVRWIVEQVGHDLSFDRLEIEGKYLGESCREFNFEQDRLC